MKSLGWNMRTPELPTAQVSRLWVILPRAAVPWCHCHQQLTLKVQRVLFKPLLPFEAQPLSYQLPFYWNKEVPGVERYSLGCSCKPNVTWVIGCTKICTWWWWGESILSWVTPPWSLRSPFQRLLLSPFCTGAAVLEPSPPGTGRNSKTKGVPDPFLPLVPPCAL